MTPISSSKNIYKGRGPPGIHPSMDPKTFCDPKIDPRKASSADGEGGLHHEEWSVLSLLTQVWSQCVEGNHFYKNANSKEDDHRTKEDDF